MSYRAISNPLIINNIAKAKIALGRFLPTFSASKSYPEESEEFSICQYYSQYIHALGWQANRT